MPGPSASASLLAVPFQFSPTGPNTAKIQTRLPLPLPFGQSGQTYPVTIHVNNNPGSLGFRVECEQMFQSPVEIPIRNGTLAPFEVQIRSPLVPGAFVRGRVTLGPEPNTFHAQVLDASGTPVGPSITLPLPRTREEGQAFLARLAPVLAQAPTQRSSSPLPQSPSSPSVPLIRPTPPSVVPQVSTIDLAQALSCERSPFRLDGSACCEFSWGRPVRQAVGRDGARSALSLLASRLRIYSSPEQVCDGVRRWRLEYFSETSACAKPSDRRSRRFQSSDFLRDANAFACLCQEATGARRVRDFGGPLLRGQSCGSLVPPPHEEPAGSTAAPSNSTGAQD